jgi:probable HAF family extracellular repeat protein
MTSHIAPGVVLALSTIAAASTSWALPAHYHVTDLGPASQGLHINADGVVSGIDARNGVDAPALWVDGVVTDLATIDGWGSAEGVNASNVTSGYVQNASGFPSAASWASDGALTDLGAIVGATFSDAPSINDQGDCLVNAELADGTSHAYIAPGCTGETFEDYAGHHHVHGVSGVAINSKGEVVGTASFGHKMTHAFLYKKGKLSDLGVLPGFATSEGRGLNAKGHVVGRSQTGQGKYHKSMGQFWNGETLTAIGTLGGLQSIPNGINIGDVIVGISQDQETFWRPFVLDMGTPGSRMIDLNTMLDASGAGWTLIAPLSINDAGQIVATGVIAGDSVERSAILTPAD